MSRSLSAVISVAVACAAAAACWARSFAERAWAPSLFCLLGAGLLGLLFEDPGQDVCCGEAVEVGPQRPGCPLDGDVLVEHALGAVRAHHRAERGELGAQLVGSGHEPAGHVPLLAHRLPGGLHLRPVDALLGEREQPHRTVVRLGGGLRLRDGDLLLGGEDPILGGEDPIGPVGARVRRSVLTSHELSSRYAREPPPPMVREPAAVRVRTGCWPSQTSCRRRSARPSKWRRRR